MTRAVALVLVLVPVAFARRVDAEGGGRFATMALGFLLIVATLAGEAFERVRLPRLTGYLATGLCVGPAVLDLVTPAMTAQLRVVNGLAIALMAFTAGLELDTRSLRAEWRGLLRHGGALVGVVFAGLALAAFAVSPWLPFLESQGWGRRAAFALVFGAVLATFSPAVTMAVLSETRARGPLARRVLQLVVAGDVAIVLLFTAATAAARMLDGGSLRFGPAVAGVAWEVVGSLLVGVIAGVAITAYRHLAGQRSGLFVAAACLLVAEVGGRIGLSPVLASLVAGLLVREAAPAAARQMQERLARVRLPVLVIFFAAAGLSLHVDGLGLVGVLAVATVLVRGALLFGANGLGARWGGFSGPAAPRVPYGLISQAGVTLGLAVIVGRDFGDWGRWLEALVLATVSLHEMVGPVAFRIALQKAGEVASLGEAHAAVEAVPAEAVVVRRAA